MQFSILVKSAIILATLLASVEGAPASPNSAVIYKRNSINDCGDSSFTDESSSASPAVADCLQIAENIAGGGTWTVFPPFQHQLVQYGTCAFGVTALGAGFANIGNQDIIDLINSSVQMFSWFGLVGSKGTMPCQPEGFNDQEMNVNWGIYHT
jgi:hypothetical protein